MDNSDDKIEIDACEVESGRPVVTTKFKFWELQYRKIVTDYYDAHASDEK